MKQGVSILILNANDQVLCVSRKPDHLQWGMPGGKVERGESPLDAAMRELGEETNIKCWPWNLELIYVTHQYGWMNYTYLLDKWKGELKSEQGYKLEWKMKADLIDNSPFGEYNAEVLKSYAGYIS